MSPGMVGDPWTGRPECPSFLCILPNSDPSLRAVRASTFWESRQLHPSPAQPFLPPCAACQPRTFYWAQLMDNAPLISFLLAPLAAYSPSPPSSPALLLLSTLFSSAHRPHPLDTSLWSPPNLPCICRQDPGSPSPPSIPSPLLSDPLLLSLPSVFQYPPASHPLPLISHFGSLQNASFSIFSLSPPPAMSPNPRIPPAPPHAHQLTDGGL